MVETLVATDFTFINQVAFRGIVVSASFSNIYNNNCWVRSPIGIGGISKYICGCVSAENYFPTRSIRSLHSLNASLESSPSQSIITLLKIM